MAIQRIGQQPVFWRTAETLKLSDGLWMDSSNIRIKINELIDAFNAAVAPPFDTYKVKVEAGANDTTPDFLASKLVAGTGISFTLQNVGADEKLKIDATAIDSGWTHAHPIVYLRDADDFVSIGMTTCRDLWIPSGLEVVEENQTEGAGSIKAISFAGAGGATPGNLIAAGAAGTRSAPSRLGGGQGAGFLAFRAWCDAANPTTPANQLWSNVSRILGVVRQNFSLGTDAYYKGRTEFWASHETLGEAAGMFFYRGKLSTPADGQFYLALNFASAADADTNALYPLSVLGNIYSYYSGGTGGQFISNRPTGTKPIDVSSTTLCNNLNAEFWNGHSWGDQGWTRSGGVVSLYQTADLVTIGDSVMRYPGGITKFEVVKDSGLYTARMTAGSSGGVSFDNAEIITNAFGSIASPATLGDPNYVCKTLYESYTGSNYYAGAELAISTDGTQSGTAPPMRFEWWTANGSALEKKAQLSGAGVFSLYKTLQMETSHIGIKLLSTWVSLPGPVTHTCTHTLAAGSGVLSLTADDPNLAAGGQFFIGDSSKAINPYIYGNVTLYTGYSLANESSTGRLRFADDDSLGSSYRAHIRALKSAGYTAGALYVRAVADSATSSLNAISGYCIGNTNLNQTSLMGLNFFAQSGGGTSVTTTLIGAQLTASINGTVTTGRGLYGVTSGAGSFTTMVGVDTNISNTGNGTTVVGFRSTTSPSGSATSVYGVQVQTPGGDPGLTTTYSAVRIENVCYAGGDSGFAAAMNAIDIAAHSAAGDGFANPEVVGNIYMRGGDWDTGHIQLNTGHIWATSGIIRLRNGAPGSATDGALHIGYSSGHRISFLGVTTPIACPGAYTQTYATASRTNPNMTATTVTDTNGAVGFAAAADRTAVVTAVNNLITDTTDLKKLVNQIIDDLQAYGLLQ